MITTAQIQWNLKQTEHVQWNSMKRVAQLLFHNMVQEQPKSSLGWKTNLTKCTHYLLEFGHLTGILRDYFCWKFDFSSGKSLWQLDWNLLPMLSMLHILICTSTVFITCSRAPYQLLFKDGLLFKKVTIQPLFCHFMQESHFWCWHWDPMKLKYDRL